jgi:hypothetical protein
MDLIGGRIWTMIANKVKIVLATYLSYGKHDRAVSLEIITDKYLLLLHHLN